MNMLHVFVLGEWQPIEVRRGSDNPGSALPEWGRGGILQGECSARPDVYTGTSPGRPIIQAAISVEWLPVYIRDSAPCQGVGVG